MDLRINYTELDRVGSTITQKGEEFAQLLTNIKNVNEGLKAAWEGSDASTYTKNIETQAEQMQKLSNTINEIGVFLVNVGKAYQDAMEANMNGLQ